MATYEIAFDMVLTQHEFIEADDVMSAKELAGKLLKSAWRDGLIVRLKREADKDPYIDVVGVGDSNCAPTITAHDVAGYYETRSPVPASVALQQWRRDYAIEVDEVEFDCRMALDAFKLSDLPGYVDDLHDKGYCDCGDEIFYESVERGLVADWDGPFDLYLSNEDAYWAYLDERIELEYGYKPTDRTLDPLYNEWED